MPGDYVGIDLHRRRSVIYRMTEAGERLDCVRIANEPIRLAEEVSKAGSGARVVVEATYAGYWAVELLQALDVEVHLATRWATTRANGGSRTTNATLGAWRTCCNSVV